jgi:hypothetical protein
MIGNRIEAQVRVRGVEIDRTWILNFDNLGNGRTLENRHWETKESI